jgi:hypothetical protein
MVVCPDRWARVKKIGIVLDGARTRLWRRDPDDVDFDIQLHAI